MFNLFGVRVYTTLIVVSDIRDEEDIINNIRENIISAGCFHSTHTVTFSELKEVECSAKFRSEYVQYLKWVLGDPDIVIIGEAYTDDEKKFISSFTDILSSVGISYGYYAKEKEKKVMGSNNTEDKKRILIVQGYGGTEYERVRLQQAAIDLCGLDIEYDYNYEVIYNLKYRIDCEITRLTLERNLPDVVIFGSVNKDEDEIAEMTELCEHFVNNNIPVFLIENLDALRLREFKLNKKEKKEMENTKNNTVKFDTRKILDLKETMDEIILNLTLLNEIDSLFQTNAIAKEYMDEAEYVGSPKPVVEYNKYEHALRCMIKDIINYKNLLVDHEGTIQKLKDENKELSSKIENNETNKQLQNEINKLKCENEALKYNIQKAVEAIRGELHG